MQCANPMCDVETLYFRSGSLHTIDYCDHAEAGDPDVKRRIIWLCGECSARFAVEVWRPPGQQLRSQLVNVSGFGREHAA
jgi:hypothetical protein